MGFLLLWVESLAVSLLFMAWVIACVGRWRRRWLRTVVWVSAAMAILLPYSLAALCTGAPKFSVFPDYPWFYYSLGLAVFFLSGTVVLRVVGLRRTPTAESPTIAAQWPRAKLFIAGCVALALHVATIQNLNNAAYQQIEAIRVESRKVLSAVAPATISEGENALPLYEAAAEAFQCWTGNQQRFLEEKAASFNSKNPQLLAFMREREPAVRLLHAAAKRPACVFPADPNEPGRAQFQPLENVLRPLALFLTVHCRCKLAEGNRRAAWQDVETLFQFAKHIREGKWVNTSTEGWRIEKQAIQSLQYVLSAAQPTADELAALKIDEFWSWRRSMQASLPMVDAFSLRIITMPGVMNAKDLQYYGFHLPPAEALYASTALYRIFFFPIDLSVYRHVAMATEIRLAWPYYEAIKFPIEDLATLRNPHNVGAIATAGSHVAMFFLDLPKACAKADARHATAVVALAIAHFQAKHGRLPENLDALVPEFLTVVPLDPFDGKPMKYQATASGMVIYSVGRDLVDQSDVFETPKKKPEKDDMTFQLPQRKP